MTPPSADLARQHARARLTLLAAEKDAEKARGALHRLENERRNERRNTIGGERVTVIVQVNERETKAVTMIYTPATRGSGWDYVISDVVT